jgi:serine/threonine protein kinase
MNSLKKDNKRLSKETIINWTGQMFSALDYVHSKDIIHRDMKPEYILIILGIFWASG